MTKFEDAVHELNKNPTDKSWNSFRKEMEKCKAKYYKAFYAGKIKTMKELTKSYVVIYDSKYRIMAKLPVHKLDSNGKVQGALEYLKGLEQNMVS